MLGGTDATSGHEVGFFVIRKARLNEHGADWELVKVGRSEMVVDPPSEAGALAFLSTATEDWICIEMGYATEVVHFENSASLISR